jgi:hypothetical protein
MISCTDPSRAGRRERGPEGDPHPNPPNPDEPTCAVCGGRIRVDDVVCPHCGASLAAG